MYHKKQLKTVTGSNSSNDVFHRVVCARLTRYVMRRHVVLQKDWLDTASGKQSVGLSI
ncbi:MAG: hypothetical protein WAO91_05415 [Candidatus Nitrosotenuis sp.]